jgi:hypothetical protein
MANEEEDERPPWRRPLTITFALGVVAVPTVYTLFAPELVDHPVWVRVLVLAGWVVIAVIALWLATRREEEQGEQLDHLMRDREEEQTERLWRSLHDAFERLLIRPPRIPGTYVFTFYIFDGTNLVPEWPDDPQRQALKTFPPGAARGALQVA